jgi:hypothetical protein
LRAQFLRRRGLYVSFARRLRLIATVEDPDGIRAILAALALSEDRADRAPPFAPSLDTSHAAVVGA